MHPTAADLRLPELQSLCVTAALITRGPLNDTFAGELGGRHVFVRERTLPPSSYGQAFAAERFLPTRLPSLVSIPALYAVVADELGNERYAVFEHIDGCEPDWDDPQTLDDLVELLVHVHTFAGEGFGSVADPPVPRDAEAFLTGLYIDEARRLRDGPVAVALPPKVLTAFDCFAGSTPTLVHGDVHRGNFLRGSEGRFWAVDWEAARFRVAAADFNQLHHDWLSTDQERQIVRSYAAASGVNADRLRTQIHLMRLLWHVRTFNFFVDVLRQPVLSHVSHIRAAEQLAADLRA